MNSGRIFSALYPTKCWTMPGNTFNRSSTSVNDFIRLEEFNPNDHRQIFGYDNYTFLHQSDFSNNWGYVVPGTNINNVRSINVNDGGAGAWNQWIMTA